MTPAISAHITQIQFNAIKNCFLLRRFGQAQRTSAERSAKCYMLERNVFYWWAH